MTEKRVRYDGGSRDLTPPPHPEPLRVPVVDSHCHLDLMDVPVAESVAAAVSVGVTRMLTIGVDVATSQLSADTAAAYDEVFAGVAIHPNEAFAATAEALSEIARLAALPQVRAVGETGLDWYRDTATREQQEASFRAHIDIAKSVGKPVVIHDRDAHADILRVLQSQGAPETVVFHCFSGDAEFARECIDRGYVLSFAGTVTFRNARQLREALAITPLDQVLVETDAPFLTPTPFRGRPNGPYMIPVTVRAMAEVKGIGEDEMAAAIAATAERCFGPW
ncbi:MAG: TatD DNase family protein [Frankiaceae bacterium]|nr:TatD DNase family protein [Frankiaceae bacterium]